MQNRYILILLLGSLLACTHNPSQERDPAGIFFPSAVEKQARSRISDLKDYYVNTAFLEDVIIETYRRELIEKNIWSRDHNKMDYQEWWADWYTPIISCKNGRLEKLVETKVLGKYDMSGAPNAVQPMTFSINDNNEFLLSGGSNKCSAEGKFESQYLVTKTSGTCSFLKVGHDVLERGAPFYSFPGVANSCCKKKGCVEKVNNGLYKIVTDYLANKPAKEPTKAFMKKP